ncbi:MAG: hypothetical protein IT429_09600 [Gemmataceae bacterium]|nr:hypothetical protein [Gemmataceae bacterium]
MDQLLASLLDLLHELQGRDVPITVGGGFGLFLKRRHLEATSQRTLFDRLPAPRATNDLDLFLRTEVLVNLERTRLVAEAITRLGYTVVEAAKYLQWQREVLIAGVPQQVKIDVLVGPLGDVRKKLNVNMPRVRPKGKISFHAHAVEEAVRIEDEALAIPVSGTRSIGEPCTGSVFIPQAFPYLMMKLHAFADRRKKAETAEDEDRRAKEQDKERQHAIDLYAIVGMMTESEYERAKELGTAHAANEHVGRARAIVRDYFAGRTESGVLRLREHPLFREDFLLEDFISVLGEIYPSK